MCCLPSARVRQPAKLVDADAGARQTGGTGYAERVRVAAALTDLAQAHAGPSAPAARFRAAAYEPRDAVTREQRFFRAHVAGGTWTTFLDAYPWCRDIGPVAFIIGGAGVGIGIGVVETARLAGPRKGLADRVEIAIGPIGTRERPGRIAALHARSADSGRHLAPTPEGLVRHRQALLTRGAPVASPIAQIPIRQDTLVGDGWLASPVAAVAGTAHAIGHRTASAWFDQLRANAARRSGPRARSRGTLG